MTNLHKKNAKKVSKIKEKTPVGEKFFQRVWTNFFFYGKITEKIGMKNGARVSLRYGKKKYGYKEGMKKWKK